MKNILIGLLIIIIIAFVTDFFYTEKNTCNVAKQAGVVKESKCGFLKKELDIDLELFNRYW